MILLGDDDGVQTLTPRASPRRSPADRAGTGDRATMSRMTNLNVPGLGTFADVGAYMHGVGEAARARRARARARRHRGEESRAARDGGGDPRATRRGCSPRTREDVDAARAAGTTPRSSTG